MNHQSHNFDSMISMGTRGGRQAQLQQNGTFAVKSMNSKNPDPSCHLGQFTGIESEPILAAEIRSSLGVQAE
jgi:hypothetical protein